MGHREDKVRDGRLVLRKAGAGHWNLVYDTNVQFRQPKVKCLLKLESQAYNSCLLYTSDAADDWLVV